MEADDFAGQGTYSVNTSTGVVTFTPLPSFTGVATPVTYQALGPANEVASSTYTPTVIPLPLAKPLSKVGPEHSSQTFDVMGAVTTPLGTNFQMNSLRLCDPLTTPRQSPPNCTATSVTIPNHGTYRVDLTTGQVTFTPAEGFIGAATQITYQVTNSVGGVASSTISPTIDPQPVAAFSNATSLAKTGLNFLNFLELALSLFIVGTATSIFSRRVAG